MNRRTTLSAPADDLATLEWEAKRREVSLTTLLAEAVTEKAESIRQNRPRIRWGTGRSKGARSAAAYAGEPASDQFRYPPPAEPEVTELEDRAPH